MRTTIELPDKLFRQAKARAALDGLTLKELMTRFVEQGLRRLSGDAEDHRDRRPSPIPIARPARGVELPALDNEELYQLLDSEDAERAGFR